MNPKPDRDTHPDSELQLDPRHVQLIRDLHDPDLQDHGYQRCGLCDFTRHPCDTYDLAIDWLLLYEMATTSTPTPTPTPTQEHFNA